MHGGVLQEQASIDPAFHLGTVDKVVMPTINLTTSRPARCVRNAYPKASLQVIGMGPGSSYELQRVYKEKTGAAVKGVSKLNGQVC